MAQDGYWYGQNDHQMSHDGHKDGHKVVQDGYKDGMDGHMDGMDRVSPLVTVTVCLWCSMLVNILVTVSLLINV